MGSWLSKEFERVFRAEGKTAVADRIKQVDEANGSGLNPFRAFNQPLSDMSDNALKRLANIPFLGNYFQNEHDERREDTSYQRTVEDMLRAGLNPSTLTGGTDTANPSTVAQDLETARTNRVTEDIAKENAETSRQSQITEAKMKQAEIAQRIAELEELKNTNKWTQEYQRELNKLKSQENALKKTAIDSENATREQQRINEIRDRDEEFFLHGLSIGGISNSANVSVFGNGLGGSGVSGITGGIQDFIPPAESKKGYNKLRKTRKDLPEDYSFADNYIGTKQSVNGNIICGFTDPNGRIMYFSYDGKTVKTSDMSQKEWDSLNDLYSSGVQ